MTTPMIYAGFIALVITIVCCGLFYVAGLKTGRHASVNEVEELRQNQTALRQLLEASEAALADSSLAYRELHDYNRQRMLRKLLEDADLATLVVVTDTLKTAADTFRTVAGDPPADATMKQRALVGKMIERMSAVIAAPEPDYVLIEWLNEHATLSADFETVTLRFDLASTEVGFYNHVRDVITTAAEQQQDREFDTAMQGEAA